jgi:hypothetical protein
MKILFFTGLLFLIGCSSPRLEEKKAALNGTWLPRTFLDSLTAKRSAYQCWSLLRGISEFRYNARTESLFVGWNNHEGLDLQVEASISSDSLILREEDYGRVYVVRFLDEENAIVVENDQTMVSVAKISKDPSFQLNDHVSGHLLAGSYRATDSLGRTLPTLVRFGADGTVLGLPSFARYAVVTDFLDDIPQTDILILEGISPQDRRWFAWKFSADTLLVYRFAVKVMIPDAESAIGALQYTFVKTPLPL